MRFSKPKHIWQWLMLLTPAAIIILAPAVTPNREFDRLATGLITGPIGAVLCLGFGFWLARESDAPGWKILGGVLCSAALAAVNLAIALSGCSGLNQLREVLPG